MQAYSLKQALVVDFKVFSFHFLCRILAEEPAALPGGPRGTEAQQGQNQPSNGTVEICREALEGLGKTTVPEEKNINSYNKQYTQGTPISERIFSSKLW